MAPPVPRHNCGLPIPRRTPGSRRAVQQRDDVALSAARAATTSPWLSTARRDAMSKRMTRHRTRGASRSQGHSARREFAQRPVTSLGISLPGAAPCGVQDALKYVGRPERDRACSAASMARWSDGSGSDTEQAQEGHNISTAASCVSPFALSSTPSSGIGSRLQARTYMTALSETPEQMSRHNMAPDTAVWMRLASQQSRLSQSTPAAEELDEVPPPPCPPACERPRPRHRSRADSDVARRLVCNMKGTCHCCIAFADEHPEEEKDHQRLVFEGLPLLNPRTQQLVQEIGAAGRFPQRGAVPSVRFVGLSATDTAQREVEDGSQRYEMKVCPQGWSNLSQEHGGEVSLSASPVPASDCSGSEQQIAVSYPIVHNLLDLVPDIKGSRLFQRQGTEESASSSSEQWTVKQPRRPSR